jgi:hypothetical protein
VIFTKEGIIALTKFQYVVDIIALNDAVLLVVFSGE